MQHRALAEEEDQGCISFKQEMSFYHTSFALTTERSAGEEMVLVLH